MTLYRRICDVITSHRRQYDTIICPVTTWIAHVIIMVKDLSFTCQVLYQKITEQYCKLTGRFLLLQNFSVAISVSPHVCFILVLILISMFLR